MKEQTIDEMVRDFTSVVPRSKSEVRRRIEELLAAELKEFKNTTAMASESIKEWKQAGRESAPEEVKEKIKNIAETGYFSPELISAILDSLSSLTSN